MLSSMETARFHRFRQCLFFYTAKQYLCSSRALKCDVVIWGRNAVANLMQAQALLVLEIFRRGYSATAAPILVRG